MDINRLHEFIVLSECLNYSKAANQLYLTQPVLSRHIHDLEETLGAQLFVRDTHKVELTALGKIAAEEIRTVLEAYNNALKNIKSATDDANGNIRVGFLGHAVKPFITQFNSRFTEEHPRIRIEYRSSDLDELIDAVNNSTLDLAFVSHVSANHFNTLEVKHVTDDRLCVVLPAEHRLCSQETVALADLSGEPLIAFSEDTNPVAADFHKILLENANICMETVRKVGNVDSGLFYTGMGIGLFLIPRHLTFMAGNMTVLPIRDEQALVSLNLIWKKGNSKSAVQTFVRDFSSFYNDRI